MRRKMAETGRISLRSFYVLSALAIAEFIWRLLIPANGFEDRSVIILNIVLNLVGLAALAGLYAYARAAIVPERLKMFRLIFALGVVSALGVLAIRFSSVHAWYSGHFINPTLR
jgi:hypothetical protein